MRAANRPRSRIGRQLRTPFGRLTATHALSASGDALFAVSLAGSLFFNVSLDAARPQVMLYLALTMAPFAIVAPYLGPLSDRFRGGHRVVLVITCLARAAVCGLLAGDLRRLLLYPEAFAVLVLGKSYSVSKSASVPGLVEDHGELVSANSRLSLVSLASGAVAGSLGSALVVGFGAPWALRGSALVFFGAGLLALRIPRVELPPPGSARDYEELHTPLIQLGAWAIALLRGSVGFLLFLLAFALRRAGEPAWFYGLVFVASGLGALAGSLAAPRLRRRLSEPRMLGAALALPALVAVGGAIRFGQASVLLVPLALGAAATVGKQAFDALVQRHAPGASRGHAFARFEAAFQLSWVIGALIPVVTRAGPRLGLGVLGTALGLVTVWYALAGRSALRLDTELRRLRSGVFIDSAATAPRDLPDEMLSVARGLAATAPARAVVEAMAALDVGVARLVPDGGEANLEDRLGPALRAAVGWSPADDEDLWQRWEDVGRSRLAAVSGEEVTAECAVSAVETVTEILDRAKTAASSGGRKG